ncbi:hypothetical protein BSR29_05295 [Boudabousia liubingyangii]|uniref:Uncharacterized protein n=1 Tax=Boudabousia liubingyangii TaxID=1921764 RepID=A0A1Q5PLG6_9ACTO|nr:hypothetical protein [Boudabousia liubingyangii]OKL47901.1 hypothetical protein BSR29_05295 [Boudabousia liubingyangii]
MANFKIQFLTILSEVISSGADIYFVTSSNKQKQKLKNGLEQLLRQKTAKKFFDTEKGAVTSLINSRRGGDRGGHGFIAEKAEVLLSNTENIMNGGGINNVCLDDNSPVDIIRDGTISIQQKFSQSGGSYSLRAVLEHSRKYPDFIENGGIYQIPKDHYEVVKKIYEYSALSQGKEWDGNSEISVKVYNRVRGLLEEIPFKNLEPSKLRYSEVQRGRIQHTIKQYGDKLKKQVRESRSQLAESQLKKTSWNLGFYVLLKGLSEFLNQYIELLEEGKTLSTLTEDDWARILKSVKSEAIFSLLKATIWLLISSGSQGTLIGFNIYSNALRVIYNYWQGKEESPTSRERLEILIELLIPLVVFVAIKVLKISPSTLSLELIIYVVTRVLHRFVDEYRDNKELSQYMESLESPTSLYQRLNQDEQQYAAEIFAELEQFGSMVKKLRSENTQEGFETSVTIARYIGINEEKILKSEKDAREYFLQ